MEFARLSDLAQAVAPALLPGERPALSADALDDKLIDRLAWSAVFGDGEVRPVARYLCHAAAAARGAWPASIHQVYLAFGRGELQGFTVPAINIRGLTYEVARAAMRAAQARGSRALIFEIARSEVGYTGQRPGEYAAVILGAAAREGFSGPIFIQGDHFQLKAATFKGSPDQETAAVASLIREAVAAGFYNIDIDASTLVDLSREGLEAQQELNCRLTADLTRVVREVEPPGVTVSVGGEIGEVGGKNSTPEELRAFARGVRERLGELAGPSKISVQTGTSHGGVPLPDGTIAEVTLDFETLGRMSRVAREEFALGGAVQHGASTLPDELFHKFPQVETLEIHLATGFQNLIYDHPAFPPELKGRIYDWLATACAGERKEGQTDAQFTYKTRKKAFGPFKRELWSLPREVLGPILADLEAKFGFLFDQLAIAGQEARLRELAPRGEGVAVPPEMEKLPG